MDEHNGIPGDTPVMGEGVCPYNLAIACEGLICPERVCVHFRQYVTKPWIGVDLDGTLAHYDGWKGSEDVGAAIAPMMHRVIDWVMRGYRVKVFTARASVPEQVPAVKAWLKKHGIGHLEVTNEKDFLMMALWDDRCVPVVPNRGIVGLPTPDDSGVPKGALDL